MDLKYKIYICVKNIGSDFEVLYVNFTTENPGIGNFWEDVERASKSLSKFLRLNDETDLNLYKKTKEKVLSTYGLLSSFYFDRLQSLLNDEKLMKEFIIEIESKPENQLGDELDLLINELQKVR